MGVPEDMSWTRWGHLNRYWDTKGVYARRTQLTCVDSHLERVPHSPVCSLVTAGVGQAKAALHENSKSCERRIKSYYQSNVHSR